MKKLFSAIAILLIIQNSASAFSLETNESKKRKWEEILNKQTEQGKACIKIGVEKKNLKINSIDPDVEISSPSDAAAKEIFSICDSIISMDFKKDLPCTLKNGEKSICSDVLCYEKDGKKLLSLGLGVTAIKAAFDGLPIGKCINENKEAKAEREKQEQAINAKKESDRIAKEEEEEKQRKWLASPEYKKQQAEIERKKIAEEKEAAAKAQKEQAEREIALRQKEEKDKLERVNYAKQYPYYALITCGMNGQHINILACFSGGVDTELEIKNGDKYGLYKAYQIHQIGRETRDGLLVDLRSNFQLKAQNSNRSLVLGVKIINRSNNQVSFEKQVAQFGVISIRNQ